jgi:hypothetical protein
MPRRLPQVGADDLNMVSLSPEVRKILRQRAHGAAKRAYAPILAADRAAFEGINQGYRDEAASVRGAAGMVQGSLAQALAGLKGSGLKGNYLRQAAGELTGMQGDAAASIPFLLADAQRERGEAMGDARQQLAQDRASMLQSSAEGFNSLLKEARGAGASELEERKDRARAAGDDGALDPVNLRNAEIALKDALRQWADNPMIEIDGEEVPLKQVNPLRSREDWERFGTGLVTEYEGFGLAEVNAVIQRLLSDRQRKEREGRLPQPGVPGAGRWAAG